MAILPSLVSGDIETFPSAMLGSGPQFIPVLKLLIIYYISISKLLLQVGALPIHFP